ncbi:MAG: hypothetical protein IH945_04630 [Armatimonadetes bacterium]|nr:hypothetical protein [Armatimonadota bacterium]
MKKLTLITRIAFLASVIVALATYLVIQHYEGKAQLVQLVTPSAGADLFGEVGEFRGTPQQLVADIPEAAILDGAGPSGAILVDVKYLEEHGIYPRQLQMVVFLAETTRTVAFYSALALLAGLLLIRWRVKSLEPNDYQLGAT